MIIALVHSTLCEASATIQTALQKIDVRLNSTWDGTYTHFEKQVALERTEANAAVDKEWNKLKNLPAWVVNKGLTQVVVNHAAHFASSTDLCHFKHAEFAKLV